MTFPLYRGIEQTGIRCIHASGLTCMYKLSAPQCNALCRAWNVASPTKTLSNKGEIEKQQENVNIKLKHKHKIQYVSKKTAL